MKVYYEGILSTIDKHIREGQLHGRPVTRIVFTWRQELVDFHSELYELNGRIFPSLFEFVGTAKGSSIYKGVVFEWPREWSHV